MPGHPHAIPCSYPYMILPAAYRPFLRYGVAARDGSASAREPPAISRETACPCMPAMVHPSNTIMHPAVIQPLPSCQAHRRHRHHRAFSEKVLHHGLHVLHLHQHGDPVRVHGRILHGLPSAPASACVRACVQGCVRAVVGADTGPRRTGVQSGKELGEWQWRSRSRSIWWRSFKCFMTTMSMWAKVNVFPSFPDGDLSSGASPACPLPGRSAACPVIPAPWPWASQPTDASRRSPAHGLQPRSRPLLRYGRTPGSQLCPNVLHVVNKSSVLCVTTEKPAAFICSTHLPQHPQLALL